MLTAVLWASLAAQLFPSQIAAGAAAVDAADPAARSPDATSPQPANAWSLPHPITDLARDDQTFRKLAKPTTVRFEDVPFSDAIQFLTDYHGLPIRIDAAARASTEISADSPLTLELDKVPARRVLNVILMPLGACWYVEAPGLVVTTGPVMGKRLEIRLNYELQIVREICELNAPQCQKLRLAGRGDIQRLLDGIQERQAKFPLVKDNPQQLADLFRENELAHERIESGPFGGGSLFGKTLETLLTPEQSLKYKPVRVVFQAGGQMATLKREAEVILAVRLGQTAFDDDGLLQLVGLRCPVSLDLTLTQVTDVGLMHLKNLPDLRELRLTGTKITDAGLAHLKGHANLEWIGAGDTGVTDAGLVHLQGVVNLQTLGLRGTKITDGGLAHLAGLKNLHFLNLTNTRISEAGVEHLKKIPGLNAVWLPNVFASEFEIAEWHQALPNVKIESESPFRPKSRRWGPAPPKGP